MCLFEKELAFESRVLNLQKFEQHGPEYLKLNPKGVVPTLVHDGEPVTESSQIIQYLDAAFPEPPLTPAEAGERENMKKWIRWSDEVGYQAVYIATWDVLSRPVAAQLSDEALEDILSRVPTEERRARWKAAAREGFSEEEFEEARRMMVETLDEMEADLASGPWLAGSAYSLGDIAMIPFVERMFDLNPELMDEERIPHIVDWFQRMQARPAFDKAFFFEGIDTRTGAIRKRLQEAGLIPSDA